MGPFPTLTLGDLDLTDWAGLQYGISVIAEGTSKGAPMPIEVAVKSWLQDGSVVVTQGYDNRTVMLRVRLQGPDLLMLAEAEAALFAELGKSNLLTWTPSDGFGPPCVFVVVTSSMDLDDAAPADLAEARAYPFRTYNIRLVCEAFVRSATETVVTGTAPGGSTHTTLDACAATTGWTGAVDGTSASVTLTGSTIAVTSGSVIGTHTITLTKTFAATTSTTDLLVADWRPTPSTGASLEATGDGVPLVLVAEAASPTSGYTRTWFRVAAPSLAVTSFVMTSDAKGIRNVFGGGGSTVRSLRLDNVEVTNAQPVTGSNRQQVLSLEVGGSARTPASLSVESATAALGDDTMVYVFPADETTTGYSPPMMQFWTAGNAPTVDAARVSGKNVSLASPGITCTVPIGLFPVGTYTLMVRGTLVGGAGSAVLTLGFGTSVSAASVGTAASAHILADAAVTPAYGTHVLGRFQLPLVDIDPAGAALATQSLTISAGTFTGLATDVLLDEAWLLNTSVGYLTWLNCGTGSGSSGGPARRLFMEPPTVETPRPTVRVGHEADRSDSYFVLPKLWQSPEFKPLRMHALVVTPNATDAVVSLAAYWSWHTNPAS